MGIGNHYFKYSARLGLINEMAARDPEGLIREVEGAYRENIRQVASEVAMRGCKILMLAGPSSSGKTTSAHIIADSLGRLGIRAVTVSLDDFLLGEDHIPQLEDGRPDYESIDTLDLARMHACLQGILRENACDLPVFNFHKGQPEPFTRHVELGARDVMIVEGIHALNPRVTESLPAGRVLKLYISVKQGIADEHGELITARQLRFIRRLIRDNAFRGSPPARTLSMWGDVCRGEELFIHPFKRQADLTINSIHLYEPCVFRNAALPLLTQIEETELYPIRRLKASLSRFLPLEPSLVPPDSMLREFMEPQGAPNADPDE